MATPRKAAEDRLRRGRPPKADATRTASVNLSEAERTRLAELHGTTYAGLRAAVAHYLAAMAK